MLSSPAAAQAPAADMAALRDQMASVNRSVDRLVALFAEFKAEQTRMNRGNLLLRRIELAQRAVATLENNLSAAKADLKTQQDLIAQSEGMIESLRIMRLQDKTGSAASAFETERAAAQKTGQQAQQAALQSQRNVMILEQDIAARRGVIASLEAALDREIGN
jgi:hypothetical protein